MSEVPVIAIDGPSGSGKGTIAAGVAARLDFHLLDSGALYRLVALYIAPSRPPQYDHCGVLAYSGGVGEDGGRRRHTPRAPKGKGYGERRHPWVAGRHPRVAARCPGAAEQC